MLLLFARDSRGNNIGAVWFGFLGFDPSSGSEITWKRLQHCEGMHVWRELREPSGHPHSGNCWVLSLANTAGAALSSQACQFRFKFGSSQQLAIHSFIFLMALELSATQEGLPVLPERRAAHARTHSDRVLVGAAGQNVTGA